MGKVVVCALAPWDRQDCPWSRPTVAPPEPMRAASGSGVARAAVSGGGGGRERKAAKAEAARAGELEVVECGLLPAGGWRW
jgi:hypothetical protein